MAQIETWFNQDLKKPVKVQYLDGNVFSQDNQGNIVGVNVFDDGEPVALSGSVSGSVVRSDGATVAISGTLSGNKASVALPQSAYAIPGVISIVIKLTSGSDITTLCAVVANVYASSTDSAVDPGTIIPSISALIAAIDAAVATIPPDYSSLVANTFNYLASQCTKITQYSDLDDYKTPGNYYVANSVEARDIDNYPFSIGGRVIVFETSASNVIVQLCIPNSDDAPKYRFYYNSWSAFQQLLTKDDLDTFELLAMRGAGTVSQLSLTDLDNAPINTIIAYLTSDIQNLTHFPEQIVKGGLIVTLNYGNYQNGRIQYVMPWEASISCAKRFYQSGWSAWAIGDGVTTITVGTGKDYENLVDALDYITSDDLRNTWNENNRVVVEVDAGTFSMNKIVDLYGQDSTRYKWGMFVPRCCTVRGKGKHQTILTYDYTGTDDWLLGHISPLNMPYESALEDLTIVAKNARYCVHSDSDDPFGRTWATSDNTITVKNVRLVHQGYSSGNDPTYNVPSAWGQGFRNNCTREFINCDFVANHMPWFTHNTIGQITPSEMIFRNCTFVNHNNASFSSVGEYGGVTFISWGTGIRNRVTLENCYSNRYMCIRGTSTYNEDTTCDYFVSDDGENLVYEGTINNAHLLDNWINRNCVVASASASLTGYKPCSIDIDGFASAYSASGYKHGIALFSCSSGDSITVQMTGLVALSRLGISGFSAGALVGWNGTAWVSDSTNPVIKVIDGNVGEII